MSLPSHSVSPTVAGVGDEPRYAFHRLMRRDERYRWWRPLAFLGTGAGFFAVLTVLLSVVILFMMMANPAFWSEDAVPFDSLDATINMADPLMFAFLMVSLIAMIPAVWLAYLLLGSRPVGLLISVAGRMRWKWLGVVFAISALLYAAYFALSFVVDALLPGTSLPVADSSIPADPLFFALLVVLLTPFQCAAEELVFRGAFMQVIGSWLKHPLFAILLPVPLFTFGHIYDVYGLLDVAVFAIAAGYLTWRTGGLEAAIGMHVINNTFLFLLGAALGLVDLNATESDPGSLAASVVLTAVATVVLVQAAKRMGVQRTAGPAPQRTSPRLLHPWPVAYPVNPQQAYWAPPADPAQPGPAQPEPQATPAPWPQQPQQSGSSGTGQEPAAGHEPPAGPDQR